MKSRIVPFVIFMIFLVSGFALRLLWFYTGQKKIVEKEFIYKKLSQDKGGANTPQEAWQKYLSALEKGNIEEALLYVWPYERQYYDYLNKLKENNLLQRYAKNHGRELRENKNIKPKLDENELAFYYDYINEKEIEILLAADDLKDAVKETWATKNANKETVTFTTIFRYNKYNKKWYLK